ncbi:hypothetical protein [Paenibacillus rhizoplanae]|uniref:Uncharacterized protein n=1 Tax=Paenibacillus rhizoplanae TaxID=1917181 RepID=A0ABW5F381_9BACL
MKKVFLAVSISALMLSMGGAVSAAPVTPTSTEVSSNFSSENARMEITFVPAGIHTMDQNVQLIGLGQKYAMQSGSNWLIWSGSTIVKLDGNKIISIGYGSAQVGAYKGDGTLLGWYFVEVVR